MTNGERFKQIFSITQVDEGELYAFAWLPNHDAAEFSIDWWNAEYNEPNSDIRFNRVKNELNRVKDELDPTTKHDLAVDCVSREKVWYMITNGKYPNEDYEQFIDRLVNELSELPSVTPQLSSELEKNSKKLEKDFGELDCISREQESEG